MEKNAKQYMLSVVRITGMMVNHHLKLGIEMDKNERRDIQSTDFYIEFKNLPSHVGMKTGLKFKESITHMEKVDSHVFKSKADGKNGRRIN